MTRGRGLRRLLPGGLRAWLLVGGLVAISLLYYRPVKSYLGTKHTLAARTAEVKALSAEKRSLEARLTLSQSGDAVIRAARRLGLVRPGERLLIVKGISSWRQAQRSHRSR
jgi:cell division protein FtsB